MTFLTILKSNKFERFPKKTIKRKIKIIYRYLSTEMHFFPMKRSVLLISIKYNKNKCKIFFFLGSFHSFRVFLVSKRISEIGLEI